MPTQTHNIRQRKLLQDKNIDIGKHKLKRPKSKSTQNGMQYSFLILIVAVIALVIILGIYTDSFHPLIDGFAVRLGYKQKIYAVIFDAGTTGSRVLAYEFHKGYLDGRLVLDNEIFKELKPGLSAFADNPIDAATQMENLLKEAKQFVPKQLWGVTPLNLKATAGLRLLEPSKADNLLNTVRDVFTKSGFLINERSVEIMDGIDEGIYSWFTVNLLLETLSGSNAVAALDLGGGSTQVTFTPKNIQQLPILKDFIHKVPVLNGDEINVFTNSYLGLGLQAVRHAVFSHGYPANETALESECVNPIVHKKLWTYATVEYAVSGKDNSKSTKENPVVDFEACITSIRNKIIPLVDPKPITLRQHQISAFSYYFDRAIETGLIDPFDGGEITVGDFYRKAKEICPIPNTDQPFMCLDILYISVLLEDGYGLQPQTKIKLHKKINGHEISWALGCAYNLLIEQLKAEQIKK